MASVRSYGICLTVGQNQLNLWQKINKNKRNYCIFGTGINAMIGSQRVLINFDTLLKKVYNRTYAIFLLSNPYRLKRIIDFRYLILLYLIYLPSISSMTWNKSSANPWSIVGSSEGSNTLSFVRVESMLTIILLVRVPGMIILWFI